MISCLGSRLMTREPHIFQSPPIGVRTNLRGSHCIVIPRLVLISLRLQRCEIETRSISVRNRYQQSTLAQRPSTRQKGKSQNKGHVPCLGFKMEQQTSVKDY
jgi:hypothetical protein